MFFHGWELDLLTSLHVANVVISQHMFFFTLSYFFYIYNNLWKKKDMIVLVHENHDKIAKCYTSLTFLQWF